MSRRAPATRRLLQLQRRIYRALRDEASQLLGPTAPAIRRYEREYEQDFRNLGRARPLSRAELVESIRDSDVTLIGDYHTFRQAQRTALRLMRDVVRAGAGPGWLLGMEMIRSEHQAELDRFQAGALDEASFRRCVDYDRSWGFAWENYAEIFAWARRNRVPVIALNPPRNQARAEDLHLRDEWAAARIQNARQPGGPYAGRQVLALMGDLHVARAHLPRALHAHGISPRRILSVHQNHDRVYWMLAEQGHAHETSAVRLSEREVCVVSGTPWGKLESLIHWTETGGTGRSELDATRMRGEPDEGDGDGDGDGIEDDHEPDYLATLRVYGSAIAGFFEVPVPSFDAVSLQTILEADFVETLDQTRLFNRVELSAIRQQVAFNQRLYIPRLGIAYLGTPSQNGLAELASLHLYRAQSGDDRVFRPAPEDFFRLVCEYAFGFLGSLIINPRRKCELPEDLAARLATATASGPESRSVIAIALAALAVEETDGSPFRPGQRLPIRAMDGARLVGEILGMRLHVAILRGEVTPAELRGIFWESAAMSDLARYQLLSRRAPRRLVEGSKSHRI